MSAPASDVSEAARRILERRRARDASPAPVPTSPPAAPASDVSEAARRILERRRAGAAPPAASAQAPASDVSEAARRILERRRAGAEGAPPGPAGPSWQARIAALDPSTPATRAAGAKVGNVVLDTLRHLDRPRNALAVGVREAATGGSFLEGAGRGAMLEDYASTQQLIPESFRREHPVISTTAGIVGDVLTDPLLFVPGKWISTPAKAIAKAKPTRAATRAALDNPLGRSLNVYFDDAKDAKEVLGKWRDWRFSALTRAEDDAHKLDALIKDLADKVNTDPSNLKAQITEAVETGQLHAGDDAWGAVRDLEKDLIARNRAILSEERAAGVEVGDLGETYMAHTLTKEGRKALRKAGRQAKREGIGPLSKQHPSAEARKLEGTVAEINAKGMYGSGKFFHDDPAIIQAVRQFRHANALGTAKFTEDIKRFGMTAKEAPEDWKAVRGIAGLEGLRFPPEVAPLVRHGVETLGNPAQLNDYMRLLDQATRWWKLWTLMPRPAYHARNFVGNLWNNYLGGVQTPGPYKRAWEILKQANKRKFASQADAALYDAMRDRGVLGRGQFTADFERGVFSPEAATRTAGQEAGRLRNPARILDPTTGNPAVALGARFGRNHEEWARIAHFVGRVDKGDTFDEAARSVKKHLFDYADLSPFEQNVMKRAMPFYTWTRKNLPLQLEYMLTRPDKYQKINIVRQNVEQDVDVPEEHQIPEWIREAGPIFHQGGDEARAVTLMNYHPAMDVERLADPLSLFGQMLTPFIKTPAELATNVDVFRQRELQEFPGQGQDFLGLRLPKRMVHTLRNIVLLNELDRANPFSVFGAPPRGEEERTRGFGMREGLFAEVFGQPFGVGALRETRNDLAAAPRLVQYLTGLREYAFEPTVEEDRAIRALQRELQTTQAGLKTIARRAMRTGRKDTVREVERAMDRLNDKLDRLSTR